jgi:hypothetical protein
MIKDVIGIFIRGHALKMGGLIYKKKKKMGGLG